MDEALEEKKRLAEEVEAKKSFGKTDRMKRGRQGEDGFWWTV